MSKILIVDDEPYIRLLLQQTLEDLEEEGVEILTADNGEEALKQITEQRPQLVFLDIMMPKMNGFDVCDTIKNKMELQNIYIALLTAKGQEFDKIKGKQVKADIYMTKPFNPDEIVEMARKILGMK